jgi:hypothetical protein
MFVLKELLCSFYEPKESLAVGPEPDITLPVFQNGKNGNKPGRRFLFGRGIVIGETIAIVSGQSHTCAEPEKAFLILDYAGNTRDGFSAVFWKDVFEPDVSSVRGKQQKRRKDENDE